MHLWVARFVEEYGIRQPEFTTVVLVQEKPFWERYSLVRQVPWQEWRGIKKEFTHVHTVDIPRNIKYKLNAIIY